MTDSPDDPEANSIAMLVPTAMSGPVTIVKVRYKDEAEVVLPVNVTIAASMVASWEGLVKDKPDPRKATRDAIINAFQREDHLTENGMESIVAAVLFNAWTGGNAELMEATIERGGHMIDAKIIDIDGESYRFRVEVVELT